MITPTVGRVVWYRPQRGYTGSEDPACRYAAHVAKVNPDGSVNLMVIDPWGQALGRVNVILAQDREPQPGEAEWMPFQKGQAAKTEAAEATALTATTSGT
jgi:hypothetical protein